MTRLAEIKKRCEQAKLDVVIYSGALDEISSEPGEIRVFNPGPNPIFDDTLWLVTQVEKAIEMAKFHLELDEDDKEAREFLEQIK